MILKVKIQLLDFRYSQDGDTKRGDVGLIKVKKQIDFKIHLGDFQHF